MTDTNSAPRIVAASREIDAPAEVIFELIADPAKQPRWDGNDNLSASSSPRVREVGDVFEMELTKEGAVRANRVVKFEEGRRIAWLPAPVGEEPPGHLWRWELEPLSAGATKVTHTYDWTNLADERRIPKAKATTAEMLDASIARLAEFALRDLEEWPPQDA